MMRTAPRIVRRCLAGTFVLSSLVLSSVVAGLAASRPAVAADPEVIAVVGCDGYADLKKQIRWIGTLVGNPALDGFAESFVMMATQFKGLAGLDVNRPAGLVVSAVGEAPSIQGFVPVKDLAKLLAALAGVIGPAEQVGDGWRIAAPGGLAVDVVEKDGWAIFSQQGSPAAITDPTPFIDPLVKSFTVGIQVFPSRMPEGLRGLLRMALEQAAASAEGQGQPVDKDALAAALAALNETESLTLGVNLDMDRERAYVEARGTMPPGSAAAAIWSDAAKGAVTVGDAATGDGKAPAIRAHYAQPISATVRDAVAAGLDAGLAQAVPDGGNDPITTTITGVVRELAAAMLEAGAIDTSLSIDTSAAGPDQPVPAITLGARIKDGAALEKTLKARLGAEGVLPPNVKAKFDAGKEGTATLHEIVVDLTGLPAAERFGGGITATLAVAPEYAFLMTGPDVSKRLAAALRSSGAANPQAKPISGVDISLASLLGYALKLARVFSPDDPGNVQLEAMATTAADKPATLVQLLVRPIERGMALRLSADAGAIESVAAGVTAAAAAAPNPAGAGPLELRPRPATPAIAP